MKIHLDTESGINTFFVFLPIYLVLVGLLSTNMWPLARVSVPGAIFTVVFAVARQPPEDVVQTLIAVVPLVCAAPAIIEFVPIRNKQEIGNTPRRQNIDLREGHHRMKNQIALLSGIVALQDEEGDFPGLKAKLLARLDALAAVEAQLHKAPDFGNIPLRSFLRQIIQGATDDPWVSSGNIEYRLESDAIEVPAVYGSRLGVIVIELIINAQKHAFVGHDGGTVTFTARETDRHVELEYRDNGVGIPVNLDLSNTSSLGLALIREAVRDLRGDVSLHSSSEGLTVRIVFPPTRNV